MIVFAIYALLVWWLAARWRRTWTGVTAVVAGTGLAALTAWLVPTTILPVDMRLLVFAEAGAILAVGAFILALPVRRRETACVKCAGALVPGPGTGGAKWPICAACGIQHGECEWCGHSLNGLPIGELVCPECGTHREGYTAAGGAVLSASMISRRAASRAAAAAPRR